MVELYSSEASDFDMSDGINGYILDHLRELAPIAMKAGRADVAALISLASLTLSATSGEGS